jgi:hypothetical protein
MGLDAHRALAGRALAGLAALVVAGGLVAPSVARAQLRPEQVLLVYDARVSDSLEIAAYYAGSAKVPGASVTRAGTRPGVRVMNLAGSTSTALTGPDIDYGQFTSGLRNPIRSWLAANDPRNTIRCIVLTKGIPFRIYEMNYPGEVPSQAGARLNAGTYGSSSVDSELSLLRQDLGGMTNTTGGTFSTGGILNPYWLQTQPINAWPSVYIGQPKAFVSTANNAGLGLGGVWSAPVSAPGAAANPNQLTPGDIYIVCRLDGTTLAQVQASLDRAVSGVSPSGFGAAIPVNVDAVSVVLDESDSNGFVDVSFNNEIDNQSVTYGLPGVNLKGGDDYEQTRYLMTGINPPSNLPPSDGNPGAPDARFASANVFSDASSGATNFFVGPRVTYGGTVPGQVISGSVLLLATYGANHNGTPGNAATTYPSSFNYHPAAVFNTIESFNGRQLNGVPVAQPNQSQFFQGQIADFIAAGGTFGVANVWEPFAFSVADNYMIARNFLQGHLSWGEAAYSSLQFLSWQQIVLGDPLARVVRSREDMNSDGRVNIDDLYLWTRGAIRTDINRDGVANTTDQLILEGAARSTRDTDMRGTQR